MLTVQDGKITEVSEDTYMGRLIVVKESPEVWNKPEYHIVDRRGDTDPSRWFCCDADHPGADRIVSEMFAQKIAFLTEGEA